MFLRNIFLPNIWHSGKFNFTNITCNQKIIVNGKGVVDVGSGTVFGYKLGGRFKNGYIELQARSANARILIGEKVSTNNNLFICSENLITIGDKTLIGQNVTIIDFDGHGILPNERHELGKIGFVHIANNVWIGNNVQILKNTVVGENSVIAAGSIVCGNFPENVIIGGIPAKVMREL
jgi:acetyltransferase-like isoleucine patch superfamily enzyme